MKALVRKMNMTSTALARKTKMSEREDKQTDCEFASSLAVSNSNKESSTRDFSSKQDDSPIDIHSVSSLLIRTAILLSITTRKLTPRLVTSLALFQMRTILKRDLRSTLSSSIGVQKTPGVPISRQQ